MLATLLYEQHDVCDSERRQAKARGNRKIFYILRARLGYTKGVNKEVVMSKNPVVHFEMPYKDGKRVVEFYSKAFGWQMNETGPEMGAYITAGTAETDENRMVKNPGNINGGFYDLNATSASPAPSVVISVPDLQEAIRNIEAAGGKLLGEPTEIPGIGLWVSFEDSEGNRVSILQSSPEMTQNK